MTLANLAPRNVSGENVARASSLTIGGVKIKQDAEGRYCLNDLHKAAVADGANKRTKEPAKYMATESFADMVAELTTQNPGSLKNSGNTECPAIYQILNRCNGKVYIGSAVNPRKRWNLHRHHLRKGIHHSVKLQRAWNKYGEDAFAFEVVRIIDGKERLVEEEQTEIEFRRSFLDGYNSRPVAGSQLGYKASDTTRRKLSIANTGRTFSHSEETKAKIGAANKGKKRTLEDKKKLSDAKIGKKHTETSKKAMSDAQRLRRETEEVQLRRDNSSGFTGVRRLGNRFSSRIGIGGRQFHIGLFDTAEEAYEAYLEAKRHSRALLSEVKRLEF